MRSSYCSLQHGRVLIEQFGERTDVIKTIVPSGAPGANQGGSGGPVFNKSGRVVAVEYAILGRFGGNSFGVPVRFAHDLLRAARKKPAATIVAP